MENGFAVAPRPAFGHVTVSMHSFGHMVQLSDREGEASRGRRDVECNRSSWGLRSRPQSQYFWAPSLTWHKLQPVFCSESTKHG